MGAEIAGGYLGETDLQLARLGIVARDPRRDPFDLDALRFGQLGDVALRELDLLLRLVGRRERREQGVRGGEVRIELDRLLQIRDRLADVDVVDMGKAAFHQRAGFGGLRGDGDVLRRPHGCGEAKPQGQSGNELHDFLLAQPRGLRCEDVAPGSRRR